MRRKGKELQRKTEGFGTGFKGDWDGNLALHNQAQKTKTT